MKLTLAVPELGPSSPIEPPTAPSISPDETASGEPLERALWMAACGLEAGKEEVIFPSTLFPHLLGHQEGFSPATPAFLKKLLFFHGDICA